MILEPEGSLALSVVETIQRGDVEGLKRMLVEQPGLATARVGDPGPYEVCPSRTLLHIATDWPGKYPNCAAVIATLVSAGADVNARFTGPHTETPLHWAASNDDIEALDALLERGADIEAPGAVIGEGDGTPLADAVAFGQWNAARRLVERGAKTTLWQAAALGLMDRFERFFDDGVVLGPHDVSQAFWCACHGGQRETAEYLLKRGADLNWYGYDYLTPLGAAKRAKAADLVAWLQGLGAA